MFSRSRISLLISLSLFAIVGCMERVPLAVDLTEEELARLGVEKGGAMEIGVLKVCQSYVVGDGPDVIVDYTVDFDNDGLNGSKDISNGSVAVETGECSVVHRYDHSNANNGLQEQVVTVTLREPAGHTTSYILASVNSKGTVSSGPGTAGNSVSATVLANPDNGFRVRFISATGSNNPGEDPTDPGNNPTDPDPDPGDPDNGSPNPQPGVPGGAPPSTAWHPGPGDTCTEADHDRYQTVAPNGLAFPTWHPPIDPSTGCSFGHDHGRDPRGSNLFGEAGQFPFGYVAEQLAAWNPALVRHEDHVGHKIEWENGIQMNILENHTGRPVSVQCDVLTKLHQGTHSADAFKNTLHEWFYFIDCTDGTKLSLQMMANIGMAGGFHASCSGDFTRFTNIGTPVPAATPLQNSGRRLINDDECINRYQLRRILESWEVSQRIYTSDGRLLVHADPYYKTENPSRFYDPRLAGGLASTVDLCYSLPPSRFSTQDILCEETRNSSSQPVGKTDFESRFNGALRFVDVNSNNIWNGGGPSVWYTDPLGKNASPNPFPGSIRQVIASLDRHVAATGLQINGPKVGFGRDYGPPGSRVHAPN